MYIDDWKKQVEIPIIGEENPEWKINNLFELLKNSFSVTGKRLLDANYDVVCMIIDDSFVSYLSVIMVRHLFPKKIIFAFVINNMNPNIYLLSQTSLGQNISIFDLRFARNEKRSISAFKTMEKETEVFGKKLIEDRDIDLFILYEDIKKFAEIWNKNIAITISTDGVNELFGKLGYIETPDDFKKSWNKIPSKIVPHRIIASYFGIRPLFPFLDEQTVEFISHIPLTDRIDKNIDSLPLRRLLFEIEELDEYNFSLD